MFINDSFKIIQNVNVMRKHFLNRVEVLILFVIWPLLGLLAACGQFQNKRTRFICVLFGMLFGYTFIVANESIDSYRYALEFQRYCNEVNDWEQWLEITLSIKGTQFIVPLIYTVTSLFSNDYHISFAIFGMLFSYFMIRTIGVLYDCNKNNSIVLKLLLIVFLLSLNFIFNINGARMWVAMWMLCYALLSYWNGLLNKSSCYILLILTIFMHWSFLFALLFFIFYESVHIKKELLLYVLLIISFVVRPFFVSVVQSLPFLHGFYESKIMAYTSTEASEILEGSRQNASFLYGIYQMAFAPAVLILLMYVRKSVIFDRNVIMKNMYYFALMIYSFINAGANVYEVNRFMTLFECIAVFFIYSALGVMPLGKKRFVTLCMLPLLGFSIVKAMLLGRDVTSLNLFLPIPFYWIQSASGVI